MHAISFYTCLHKIFSFTADILQSPIPPARMGHILTKSHCPSAQIAKFQRLSCSNLNLIHILFFFTMNPNPIMHRIHFPRKKQAINLSSHFIPSGFCIGCCSYRIMRFI